MIFEINGEVYIFNGIGRVYIMFERLKFRTIEELKDFMLRVSMFIIYVILGIYTAIGPVNVAFAADGQAHATMTDEWYKILMWLLMTVLPVLVHMYFKSEMKRIESGLNAMNQRLSELERDTVYREEMRDINEKLRDIIDVVNSLRTDFNEWRLSVTENYAKKTDVDKEIKHITRELDAIKDDK